MVAIDKIQENAEVVDSAGDHVGTVDHMDGSDKIKLTKKDPEAAGEHHYIPVTWVAEVSDGKVKLSKTCADAEKEWQAAN